MSEEKEGRRDNEKEVIRILNIHVLTFGIYMIIV